MNLKQIKAEVTKENLIKAYLVAFTENNREPRLMRLSMSEALNTLQISNSTKKVSTGTLESLLQWIEA